MIGANALARSVPFIAIMGAAIYFYYLSDHLDFEAVPGRAGPDLWPKIILGLMILTCAIGIIKSFLTRSAPAAANLLKLLAPQAGEEEESSRTWLHLPLLCCALFAAYVLTLDTIGFVIGTILLIAGFLVIGRYRNWTVIALSSVLGSLGFFFVFRRIVYVSLPLGHEPFLSVSLWLMKLMGMS
jgi:putative tricarboxylic transport membrane protein